MTASRPATWNNAITDDSRDRMKVKAPQRGLRVPQTHVIEIVSAVGAMALVGTDPVLRQEARVEAGAVTPSVDVKGGLKGPLRDAELRPKVGYRQVPALQKEPGHAKILMAKTVDYLLFTSHGSSLRLRRGLPRPLPYPFPRPPMATFRPADGRGEGEQR